MGILEKDHGITKTRLQIIDMTSELDFKDVFSVKKNLAGIVDNREFEEFKVTLREVDKWNPHKATSMWRENVHVEVFKDMDRKEFIKAFKEVLEDQQQIFSHPKSNKRILESASKMFRKINKNTFKNAPLQSEVEEDVNDTWAYIGIDADYSSEV